MLILAHFGAFGPQNRPLLCFFSVFFCTRKKFLSAKFLFFLCILSKNIFLFGKIFSPCAREFLFSFEKYFSCLEKNISVQGK